MFDKPLGASIVSFVRNASAVDNTPVPGLNCGSCTACCRTYGVVAYKEGDDPSLFESRNGELVLPRKSGTRECAYLGKDGCAVYEKRPAICRGFDCRHIAVVGVLPSGVHDKYLRDAVVSWDVTDGIRTPEDAKLSLVINLTKQFVDSKQGCLEIAAEAIGLVAATERMGMLPDPEISVSEAISLIKESRRISIEPQMNLTRQQRRAQARALTKANRQREAA